MNASSALKQQTDAYRDISEQFVVDASFLWLLRSISVKQPHFYLQDLADLEKRINANLDGLLCNVELTWQICLQELEYEQAGETFTAQFNAMPPPVFIKQRIGKFRGVCFLAVYIVEK